MQDIYAAIVGEPPTEQEKLAALAKKLRGQEMIGQLGMLTGDKVLAPMGEGIVEQVGDRSNKIANRGIVSQQLNRADALAAMKNQYDMEQMAKEQEFQGGQRALDRALQRELEQMQQSGMNARDKSDTDKADKAAKKELDRYTRMLSADVNKANIPFLDSAYKDLDTALRPFIGDDGKLKGDVPGIGATSLSPMGMLSKEGRPVRQAVANVRNQFLKMASGAAVTNPEAARLYEQIAMQLGGTDEDVMRGLESLRAMKDSAKTSIYAGYDPEVVETYESRQGGGGTTSAPAALNPADFATYEEYVKAMEGR